MKLTYILILLSMLVSPSMTFAQQHGDGLPCGGVCEEDDSDDVYLCFYFLSDPCDWYDHWVNK